MYSYEFFLEVTRPFKISGIVFEKDNTDNLYCVYDIIQFDFSSDLGKLFDKILDSYNFRGEIFLRQESNYDMGKLKSRASKLQRIIDNIIREYVLDLETLKDK